MEFSFSHSWHAPVPNRNMRHLQDPPHPATALHSRRCLPTNLGHKGSHWNDTTCLSPGACGLHWVRGTHMSHRHGAFVIWCQPLCQPVAHHTHEDSTYICYQQMLMILSQTVSAVRCFWPPSSGHYRLICTICIEPKLIFYNFLRILWNFQRVIMNGPLMYHSTNKNKLIQKRIHVYWPLKNKHKQEGKGTYLFWFFSINMSYDFSFTLCLTVCMRLQAMWHICCKIISKPSSSILFWGRYQDISVIVHLTIP